MIALIDYGAGNLTSVKKALAAVNADVYVPARPDDLETASGLIVPGVGHFEATRAIDRSWKDRILDLIQRGRPLLGICLGMQWLFEGSDEAPDLAGLGVLGGRCYRLSGLNGETRLKVPHVGWNSLAIGRQASIVNDVDGSAQVYFTHSFAAPITADTVATTEHGEPFASIVQRGLIAGVQFHPEKSGDAGLQMLRNFVRSVG